MQDICIYTLSGGGTPSLEVVHTLEMVSNFGEGEGGGEAPWCPSGGGAKGTGHNPG